MTTQKMVPYVEFEGKRVTLQPCNNNSIYGILATRGYKISWVTGQGVKFRIVNNKIYYEDKIYIKRDD